MKRRKDERETVLGVEMKGSRSCKSKMRKEAGEEEVLERGMKSREQEGKVMDERGGRDERQREKARASEGHGRLRSNMGQDEKENILGVEQRKKVNIS